MQPFGRAAHAGANNTPTIEAETSISWTPAGFAKVAEAKARREPEPEPEPEPDASGLDWLGQGSLSAAPSTTSALAGAQAALGGAPVVSATMSRQRTQLLAMLPPSMRELCVRPLIPSCAQPVLPPS